MPEASTAQRLDRLRSVPIFAELDDTALGRILDCASEFEARPGQVLIEANMEGSGLVVIEDGSVAVELAGGSIELAAGEFFGELSLLTSMPHVARVRTTTQTRCLAIARADFERLLEQNPKIAVAMLRAVARRLANLESR